MAGTKYKQFLRVIEQWPLDPTKSSKRDLGHLLRSRVQEEFSKGENTVLPNPQKCDKMYESIKNIAEDKYKKQYPVNKQFGCLGNTYDEMHFAVSEEGLKGLKEEGAGIFTRTVRKVKRTFQRTSNEE